MSAEVSRRGIDVAAGNEGAILTDTDELARTRRSKREVNGVVYGMAPAPQQD